MRAIVDLPSLVEAVQKAQQRSTEQASVGLDSTVEAELATIAAGGVPDQLAAIAQRHLWAQDPAWARLLMDIDYAARRRERMLPPHEGRRGILRVLYGRAAFHRRVLTAGERLTVGRGPRADWPLARDTELAPLHFELWWDGLVGHLRDLGQREGVVFEGRRRWRVELTSGDTFDAGGVTFRFFVEDASGLADDAAPPRLATTETLEPLAHRGVLYAVLDAARHPSVRPLLNEAPDAHRSLYEGDKGRTLDEVAPYLVKLEPDGGLLRRLLALGFDDAWGVFLESDSSFEMMRRSLRRLLVARTGERRDPMLFRFYDPRVLERFIPLATPRQRSVIFAEAERIFYETADGSLQVAQR